MRLVELHRATFRAGLLLSTLAVGGCDVERGLRLELPVDWDHGTELLVVHAPGVTEVHAIALEGGDRRVPLEVLERRGFVTVEALLFRKTLSELGLDAGLVPPAISEREAYPLPAADEVYVTRIGRDGVAAWERRASASSATLELRTAVAVGEVAPPDPLECWDFGPQLELGLVPDAMGDLHNLEDGIAAISTVPWEDLWIFGTSRSPTIVPNLRGAAILRRLSGEYLIAGSDGVVEARWSSNNSEFSVLRTVPINGPFDGWFWAIGGFYAEGITDVIAATRRQLFRFGGESLALMAELPAAAYVMARSGPGEAIVVVGSEQRTVLQVDSLGVRKTWSFDTPVRALEYSPVHGVLLGTQLGDIFHLVGGDWAGLGGPRYGTWVLSMLAYGDHTFVLLSSGTVVQIDEKGRFCEPVPVFAYVPRGGLAVFGRDLLVAGGGSTSTHLVLLPRVD